MRSDAHLDLYVQAANLFERTVKGIARCVVAAPAAEARLMAQTALLALLESLDAWAGPLKVGPNSNTNAIQIQDTPVVVHQTCAALPAAVSVLLLSLFGISIVWLWQLFHQHVRMHAWAAELGKVQHGPMLIFSTILTASM